MAWFSFLSRNQILTLRTKLRNAATIKKYLLLTFIFFLGGLGFKPHERCVSVSSLSGMASPRTISQGMVGAVRAVSSDDRRQISAVHSPDGGGSPSSGTLPPPNHLTTYLRGPTSLDRGGLAVPSPAGGRTFLSK